MELKKRKSFALCYENKWRNICWNFNIIKKYNSARIKGRSHQHKVIFNLGLDDVFPLLALSQGYRVIEIQLRANPGLVPIKEKN